MRLNIRLVFSRFSRLVLPVAVWLAAFAAGLPGSVADACPFCTASSQTLRQEMQTMDAVVIAEAIHSDSLRNASTGEVRMRIVTVLKGDDLVKAGQEVDAIYYGDVDQGRRFMLSGVLAQSVQWACLPVTPRAETYVTAIAKLPNDDGAKRLQFFLPYLQDEDVMLALDAYDEFAVTPYDDVKKIRHLMDHDQLVTWIQDPEMSPDRKRLYLTMLGICGSMDDVPMLEAMLQSTQKSSRSGLDALIACYLTLAGEKGLPLVNNLFMSNQQASYADTYSAIMAIRFHGTEGDVIARSALTESLHLILQRKDLADLVIPDLARWQDWSQIETVKQLFLEADEASNWIRVPVVNYLRACPLPEAGEVIDELEKVDPDSVKRANTFFPIPKPAPAKSSTSAVTPGLAPAIRPMAEPGTKTSLRPSFQDESMPRPHSGQRFASILPESSFAVVGVVTPTSPNHLHPAVVIGLALSTVAIALWLVLNGGPVATEPVA